MAEFDFKGIDLGNVDLGNIDLSAVDLGNVDLSAIDLSNVDLGGVALPGSPASVDPNSISSSVGRGVDEFQRNLYKSVEVVADMFGAENVAQWGAQGAAENLDEMMQYGAPMRLKDVASVGDFGEFVVSFGASILPTALSYVGAGVAGTLTAGPVGGVAAMGSVAASQNIGTVKNTLEDLGYDEEMGIAEWAMAGGMTALDTVGLRILAKPFTMSVIKEAMKKGTAKEVTDNLTNGLIKGGMTKAVAEQAAIGAVAEAASGMAGMAILQKGAYDIAGLEQDGEEFLYQMAEAGIMGGLAGSAFGSAGGYFKYKNMSDFISGKVVREAEVQKEKGVVGRAWDQLTGDVLAPIAAKITKTEPGRAIRETLVNEVENSHRDYRGHMFAALAGIEKTAKEVYGRGWQKQFAEDYHGGVKNKATEALTAHFDGIANKAVDFKLMRPEDKIERYAPANMDSARILNNWDTFVKDLEAEGINTKEMADILSQYREALVKDDFSTFRDPLLRLEESDLADADTRSKAFRKLDDATLTGRMGKQRVQGQMGNIEGHRLFPASQQFYNKWSKDGNMGRSFWKNVQSYSLRSAHRFAGVEHLGRNGEKLNSNIIKLQEALVNDHGERLSRSEIERLYNTVDAYEGRHGRIDDPFWRAASSISSTLINVTLLPTVTLGSLVEIFNVAAKTDMSTMVKATQHVLARAGYEVGRRAMLRGPSERHLTNSTQMAQAGQTLYSAHNTLLARFNDAAMGDISNAVSTKFFQIFGLTGWTQFLRNVGAEAMKLTLVEDINTITNFPGTSAAERAAMRIQEVGLTVEEARQMMPGSGADSTYVNHLYGKAINRFNRHVALEPSFADRPLWMSNQKMWVFSRLQGYPTMFTNTVLPMLGDKLTGMPASVIDGLFIVGGMTMVGALQMGIRDMATGKSPYEDKSAEEIFFHSFKRNVTPRPFNMMADMAQSTLYGGSPVDTAIGPVATQFNKATFLHSRLATGKIDMEEYLKEMSYLTVPAAGTFRHWWED